MRYHRVNNVETKMTLQINTQHKTSQTTIKIDALAQLTNYV